MPKSKFDRYYESMGDYHVDSYGKDEGFTKYVDAILDFFEDKKGKTILDAGAGEGLVAELLHKRGHNIEALDISEKAREYFDKRKVPIKFYCEDISTFDKKYDWILFANTLNWIEDDVAAAEKIKSLAKEGIYLTVADAMRGPLDLKGYKRQDLERMFPRSKIYLQDKVRWVVIWPDERVREACEFFNKPPDEMVILFLGSLSRLFSAWKGEEHRYEYYKKDYNAIRQMNGKLKARVPKKLRKLIGENGGGKMLLDYGCGVGDVLIYAAKRGWSVEGVEVDGITSELCEWRLKRRGIKARIYKVDEKKEYPFLSKNKYDLIVCMSTIEHLKEPKRALNIINKAIKKSGRTFLIIDDDTFYPDHIGDVRDLDI